MTSCERLKLAMNGKPTDRVPVTYFIVDQGHFIASEYPDLNPHDYAAVHRKMIELYRQLGGDILLRICYGLTPMYLQYGGLNVHPDPVNFSFSEGSANFIPESESRIIELAENWEVQTSCRKNGTSVIHRSEIKTPDGTLTQEFKITEILPNTFIYGCTEKPIKSERDLDIAMRYEPGIGSSYARMAKEKIWTLKENLGEDGVVTTWSPHGPFNIASLLVKEDDLYSLFITDPGFYEKLMRFCLSRTRDYVSALNAACVDGHCIGANVAGGFIGKRNFDSYILSYEKQHIDVVQSTGIPAIYHNCGEIMSLLDSYIEVGPMIIESFSPPPIGDGDIDRARNILKDKAVIIGNIDQVNVLKSGTPDSIRRISAETMKKGKAGGRFIFQTADFIEYDTPAKNIEAMVESALEYGDYKRIL